MNDQEKTYQLEEEEFLKTYDPSKFIRPVGVPCDIVVFTITSEQRQTSTPSLPIRDLKIMLIKRKGFPDKGKWAIPGGFSSPNETLFEAAKRELKEETGVDDIHIEQFGIYDKPQRDKRGWVISIAFYAAVNEKYLEERKAADDAEDVQLFTIEEALSMNLAFDHKDIIQDALKVLQKRMLETNIAKEFLPEEFTLSELFQVIKTVVHDFDENNFYRKLTKTNSRKIIEPVNDRNGEVKKTKRNSRRDASLYRFNGFIPQTETSIYL